MISLSRSRLGGVRQESASLNRRVPTQPGTERCSAGSPWTAHSAPRSRFDKYIRHRVIQLKRSYEVNKLDLISVEGPKSGRIPYRLPLSSRLTFQEKYFLSELDQQ